MNIDDNAIGLHDTTHREVARRLAEGKGVLPSELRNERAERLLTEEITKRARAGEHFPPSECSG